MKTRIIISLTLLTLVGCKKDNKVPTPTPQPTCDCYEYHERLTSNLGQFSWIEDHTTSPALDFCEKDDSVWNYYQNDTRRWRWICQ